MIREFQNKYHRLPLGTTGTNITRKCSFRAEIPRIHKYNSSSNLSRILPSQPLLQLRLCLSKGRKKTEKGRRREELWEQYQNGRGAITLREREKDAQCASRSNAARTNAVGHETASHKIDLFVYVYIYIYMYVCIYICMYV